MEPNMTITAIRARYREALPQLADKLFLTDGGLETTLIFHEGWELPCGEAFVLMETREGREALCDYYDRYIPLAVEQKVGFLLESPTWRANPDWGAKIGYDAAKLADINRDSIALSHEIRDQYETADTPIVISGCIGPRGDGYDPGQIMSAGEAKSFHAFQVACFSESGADLVTAMTMTNCNEAIGVAQAAAAAGMPCAISFTVETDGRLPTGQPLNEAIRKVDRETGSAPAYYMINCAHPTHIEHALDQDASWIGRLRGLRANSSSCSHQELDNAPVLDIGNPVELADQYRALRHKFPAITVLGGCCGTDHRHVREIAARCCNN
jgi:S-methylmethionine-dependent homocysteine/selenocysteine methylase